MPTPIDWIKLTMEVWHMISNPYVFFALGVLVGAGVAWQTAKAWYRREVNAMRDQRDLAAQQKKAVEEELARRGPQPALAAAAPLRVVALQKFNDQMVPLDGIDYSYCTFKNVTFVYNGTAAFALSGSVTTEGQLALTTEADRIVPLLGFLQRFQRDIPPLAFLMPSVR
jgi:hypothetical protein